MRHLAILIITASALAACSGGSMPSLPPSTGASYDAIPAACYVAKVQPQTVKATITFYGWPDNAPPGNAIAHPVIHHGAGGSGTYCDPTTFATERANNARIPYGTKIYVPFLKQYFVREDLCTGSGPSAGSGSNSCYKLWFDLWIGGDANSVAKYVFRCERKLTPNSKVNVVLNPNGTEVTQKPGPIYNDNPPPQGTCF
jgi:hypothetical protein